MINLAMILLIILGFMLFYIFILLCEASLIMASFNFSVGDGWSTKDRKSVVLHP